jgi:hypothetical protein
VYAHSLYPFHAYYVQHSHKHAYTNIQTYKKKHTNKKAYIHTYIHTHLLLMLTLCPEATLESQAHTHIHTYIHTCCSCSRSAQKQLWDPKQYCLHPPSSHSCFWLTGFSQGSCLCVYVYMYVCMYVLSASSRLTFMFLADGLLAGLLLIVCVCMYVCMYVCVYVCTHTQICISVPHGSHPCFWLRDFLQDSC